MPAQKRSSQSENADGDHQSAAKLSRRDQDPEEVEEHEPEDGGGEEDSDDSASSSLEEKPDPEFVMVKLADIRKDVQCPICLGIIKKTRTVMECLHRFCRECIDKSMRLGNNECPACRTHCASRRSLRDDPNFDALIAALYPDIDKYEEEELAFLEEEKNRNKQIQASIAQILQRQSEALVKRRSLGKDVAGGFTTRAQRNLRSIPSRRRMNSRGSEYHGSEDNEDENDSNVGKDSGSADERTEVRPKRRKKRGSHGTLDSSFADGECHGNDLEANRDSRGISPGLVWNPEMLAWGRGGTRSNTRHGGHNSSNKNSTNTRISKFMEYFRNLEENNETPFAGEYCPLKALFQPPKVAEPRGLWAPFHSFRKMEISDKTMLRGNPDLCMHLLNEILPPQERGEVPSDLNDIEIVMRSHFERLALLVREEMLIGRIVGELADKQVDLLIELKQFQSLGYTPEELEDLKRRAEASTKLVEQARREYAEREKELLASIKMREDQVMLAEDGRLRAELRTKEADKYSAQLETKAARLQGELKEAWVQMDVFRAEKEQLELKLKDVPSPQSVVENFKKSDEFSDCALEEMKAEVTAYLQILVDEIQGIDPKFPLREVKSLQNFIKNGYTKETSPAAVGEEKAAPEAEKESVTPDEPRP